MVKVGQIVRIETGYMKDNLDKHKPGRTIDKRQYKVIAIYPHSVLLEDSYGFKRCVPNGELIRAGYLKQAPMYEALRAERTS